MVHLLVVGRDCNFEGPPDSETLPHLAIQRLRIKIRHIYIYYTYNIHIYIFIYTYRFYIYTNIAIE